MSKRMLLTLIIFVGLLVASGECGGGKDRFKKYERPPVHERSFLSTRVEEAVTQVAAKIGDERLRQLWINCFPNTLDTTVQYHPGAHSDTFIITGDIEAMWLRDSTWQVECYLRFAKEDHHLRNMLKGVVQRQLRSVLIDPYANAFNYEPSSRGHQTDKRVPPMSPPVFEGKWEIDSLCCVLHLVNSLYEYTQEADLLSDLWIEVVHKIYEVFRYQQTPLAEQQPRDQLFHSFARGSERVRAVPSCTTRTGLIASFFRPSDDPVELPYFIPSNAFAVVELRRTAKLINAHKAPAHKELALMLLSMAEEVEHGIQRFATIRNPHNSSDRLLAFEVDGCDKSRLMDDANVPSLLGLPFIGYLPSQDPLYLSTRKFVLSSANRFFHSGSAGSGIGSPHTFAGSIWPMGQIFQIMTSDKPQEIRRVLSDLTMSSAGTGLLHESYSKDDPQRYSRPWFAMCNSLFGEMILRLLDRFPEILAEPLEIPKVSPPSRPTRHREPTSEVGQFSLSKNKSGFLKKGGRPDH